VLHFTCTHRNQVDSRLLVVGSQTASLTPGPSFDHNLCYKYPNGSCEAILDIYTSRTFQWYKERFDARCFDPCNRALRFWESRRTPKSHFRECEWRPQNSLKVGLRQMMPSSVIGLQFLNLEWSPNLGITMIRPLLMCVDVFPRFNMVVKALRSVGATSSAYSWKNSIGMSSCPGVLPLGREEMASTISFKVRSLVMSTFITSVTQAGTLVQHSS